MIRTSAALLAAIGTVLLIGGDPLSARPFRFLRPARRGGHSRSEITQVIAISTGAFIAGSTLCLLIFGSFGPALLGGGFAAWLPITARLQRRREHLEIARDAWPRMIDELRVLTSAAGRSLPQSLIEVGASAPPSMHSAFAEARREWLLTSDLERMLAALRSTLADPTCDAVCETLLIASEVGWSDLDRRLTVLAEDRRVDSRNRREARSRQAGVRFARRFVLLVPLGMAIAGLTVGSGRSAYRTPVGEAAVLAALLCTFGCWYWAGSMLRLPTEERVFPT
jgi:tight adherence protein B